MGRNATLRPCLLAIGAALASQPAAAHTFGAGGAGFATGFAHPLVGLDHLSAMIAVGLWAAQLGGRALWQAPAAFVVTLAAGAGLAVLGVGLPAVEPGIMASVLVLGLLIAFTVRLRPAAAMALVGAFALFHGHAHGAEMPEAANPFLYAGGFALATALLHGVGVGLGWAAGRALLPALARAAGAAFAAAGLWGLVLAL